MGQNVIVTSKRNCELWWANCKVPHRIAISWYGPKKVLFFRVYDIKNLTHFLIIQGPFLFFLK